MPKPIPIKIPDERSLRKLKEIIGYFDRRTIGNPRKGRRTVPRRVGSGKVYHFTLTENMSATTANQASCTIYTANGTTRTEYATSQTLYDPDGFLAGAVSGAKGPCIRQGGKYYAFNASCS